MKLRHGQTVEQQVKLYVIDECKPVQIPLPVSLDLTIDHISQLSSATAYWRLIVLFMYLPNTVSLDLSVLVHYLAQLTHASTNYLRKGGMHLLRSL